MRSKILQCLSKFDKRMIKRKGIVYLILFVAEIEMLFYSGILYGLNVLIPSLKKEKYFLDRCDSNFNSTCLLQNKYLGYTLVTGIVGYSMTSLPVGIFYDKFGYRYTKIFGSILFFIGSLLFGLSSVVKNELLFPAMLSLGISSQSIAISNLPLGGLIPKLQILIVSIFVGSFDISVMVFIFINLTYQSGVSLSVSFYILAITGLILLEFDAFVLMGAANEKFEIIRNMPKGYEIDDNFSNENENERRQNLTTEELNPLVNVNSYLDLIYPGIKPVLFSRNFIVQLMFFVIVFFRFSFFLAQMSLQFERNFQSDNDKVYFLSISSFFFMASIIIAPFIGYSVDFLKNRVEPNSDPAVFSKNLLSSFGIPLIVCCITNELMATFIFIPQRWAVYAAFVAFTITRVFLFTLTTSFILIAFPVRFFGKIFGITITIGGLISFIQYALLFDELSSLNIVNYSLIAISILTFIHPILLLIKL